MPQTSKDIVKQVLTNLPAIRADDTAGRVGSPHLSFLDLRDGIERGKPRVIPSAGTLE